jgi:hypothetical protein
LHDFHLFRVRQLFCDDDQQLKTSLKIAENPALFCVALLFMSDTVASSQRQQPHSIVVITSSAKPTASASSQHHHLHRITIIIVLP